MTQFTPRELQNHLLGGSILTPDELEQFIRENPKENQGFDYKDGIIATREKRHIGRQTIREYVSGFANSDGGVVIVGVNEDKPRAIAPCEPNIGGQPLDEWAWRCLQDMTGYFSPFPRCQVIQHSRGPVLAIAVARAPSLAPCVETGELKYFFRIGDSTLQIPECLIADLVLGRRQRPVLDLHSPRFNENEHEFRSREGGGSIRVREATFSCIVENLSLITAEDVKVGAILWSLVDKPRDNLNTHLLAYLEVSNPQGPTYADVELIHVRSPLRGERVDLDPFQTQRVAILEPFYVLREASTKVRGAVYVISKGAPPTWFQLDFEFRVGGLPIRSSDNDFHPSLVRKDLERPQVAWTQEPFTRYVIT